MLNLTSNRKLHVKDIASGFKGESRPENMEAFFIRRAREEAVYRHKVHEGRETHKKTSQQQQPLLRTSPSMSETRCKMEPPPVPRLEWGVHSVEMGSPITPSCYDDRAPDDHSLHENLGSPQQKEGDDLSLFALGDREMKPADAGARQPLVETSANSTFPPPPHRPLLLDRSYDDRASDDHSLHEN